jgi:multidrug resistance protein, MATE family
MNRGYKWHISETLKLSYPIIIGQLGAVLMGVADNIMVGKLGAEPLAASGVANAVYFLVMVLAFGTLTAVSPRVAMYQSAGDTISNATMYKSCWAVGWILIMAMLIILMPVTYFFEIFNQSKNVNDLAKEYLYIINISTIPFLLFYSLKQYTDGLSLTRIAMVITILGLLINVWLNWLFIYGNWGIPAFGLNGAGIATLLSRLLMFLLIILYIRNSNYFKNILTNPFNSVKAEVIQILKVGVPAGFQFFFEVAAFAGAAIIIGWIGTNELAAHQVAISIASVTYMIASGFGAAGSIRVGNAVGEKNIVELKKSGITVLGLVIVFMSLCCICFVTMPHFFVGLYINDEFVYPIAISLIIIAAFFQLSDGVQVVCLGVLRGMADVNIPMFITFFAYWIVGIPLGYILAFNYGFSAVGIWIGLSAGLTVSAILLVFRFLMLTKKKIY